MSTLLTNAILDASGGTSATINGITLRPGVLAPDNKVINGAFDFWQRGTSFSSSQYTADRWISGLSGGTVTATRQSFAVGDTLGTNNPTYFYRQTVSGQSLSTDYAIVAQRIEGVSSYAGQTVTVLGWARRSSGTGNMAISFDQFFGTGGTPSAGLGGTGQLVNLTSSWAPFAVTIAVPSIAGKTLGTNGDDNLTLVLWSSAGSSFNTRASSLGIQTIGIDLWGIHIKTGTHTTTSTDLYTQPESELELIRCLRYYTNGTFSDGGAGALKWANTATNMFAGAISFITRMRVAPTVAVDVSPTYTNCSTAAFNSISTSGFNIIVTTVVTANYRTVGGQWSADAEL